MCVCVCVCACMPLYVCCGLFVDYWNPHTGESIIVLTVAVHFIRYPQMATAATAASSPMKESTDVGGRPFPLLFKPTASTGLVLGIWCSLCGSGLRDACCT